MASSRMAFARNLRAVRHDLDVPTHLTHAFRRHKTLYLTGAAGVGWVLARLPVRKKKYLCGPGAEQEGEGDQRNGFPGYSLHPVEVHFLGVPAGDRRIRHEKDFQFCGDPRPGLLPGGAGRPEISTPVRGGVADFLLIFGPSQCSFKPWSRHRVQPPRRQQLPPLLRLRSSMRRRRIRSSTLTTTSPLLRSPAHRTSTSASTHSRRGGDLGISSRSGSRRRSLPTPRRSTWLTGFSTSRRLSCWKSAATWILPIPRREAVSAPASSGSGSASNSFSASSTPTVRTMDELGLPPTV